MSRASVVVFALLASMGTARAEVGFEWRAPASCPSAEKVRVRVERRLGAPIDGAIHGIEIEITREHGQYVAHIDARAVTVANAVRTLRSRNCDALADGVAVILARLATELRDRLPAPEHVVEMEPAPVPDATGALVVGDAMHPGEQAVRGVMPFARERTAARGWGAGVRIVGLSGVGALPGVNLGGELGGYLRRRAHFVEAAASHWAPQRKSLQGTAPAGVEVALDVLTLRAGWGPQSVPLRAWGTIELGSITGEGMAVNAPRSGSGRWGAVGGGFGVAWPMSPYARLVGSIEVVVPVGTTRFTLESGTELYRPALAAARSAFGLEVGFR